MMIVAGDLKERSGGIEMIKGAQLSDCRKYRYALWRTWQGGGRHGDPAEHHVMFIGLNPSTADETQDDPTIIRCIGFAKRWGFDGIYMLNLFAYRATSPKDLMKAEDPVGPENNSFLSMYHEPAGLNIACWGAHGVFMKRDQAVIELLGRENLSCLGITNGGQPKHPLYLKLDTKIIRLP